MNQSIIYVSRVPHFVISENKQKKVGAKQPNILDQGALLKAICGPALQIWAKMNGDELPIYDFLIHHELIAL